MSTDAQPEEASEQRARQAAVAEASHGAQLDQENSIRISVQELENRTVSPDGIDVSEQPLSPSKAKSDWPAKSQPRFQRLQDWMSGLTRSHHPASKEATSSSGRPQMQEVAVVLVGVIAAGCLVAALAAKPKPLAAALAAGLGWLAMYAYMLQVECRRLSNFLTSGRPLSSHPISSLSAAKTTASNGLGHDLDLASCAGAFGFMQPAVDANGVVQSVLTASLVNEYLRLAAALQVYRERHGPLPQSSPGFDAAGLGVAEALLAAGANSPRTSGQDLVTQRSTPASHGEVDVSAVSQVCELRQVPPAPAAVQRTVSIESPSPSPAILAPMGASNAQEGAASAPLDSLSKTVA
eukprot:CAMPEP_0197693212 /NCGR_PEP_ID=MMETSP1338-20131121/112157_1 /TAXON_ID=43686 ORGANISM="Pelagodinium beii, Strain RCC1491" /NCGR_SAMPLE_ID=MMETSP1338 /ASSEMBLY_ACC=CAM_ASM_000754 /LENGTH=350 /DNA_ID=CAMNT_0043275929 /DNA_START=68 /DNA_END=1116 /DNA_ORIENTATION=-